jgi:hypothetical protein
MLLRFCSCLFVPLAIATVLSGCGSNSVPVEKLVPASGSVTLDGKPAANVRIRLTPNSEKTKTVGGAWAVTDEDGEFTVMHWSKKEGIPPGSYLITFSKFVKPDGSPLQDGDSPAMVNAKELIAAKWSSPSPDKMTGIARRVDVPESGRSDITFSINGVK